MQMQGAQSSAIYIQPQPMAPGMMGRYPVMPMACERKRKMYELV
jgi:hypothetical protein